MNRQTILASVHRQLRESLAETGEVRPLGEIVPRVSAEIRANDPSPAVPANRTHASVIPIEKVAAFVDGHLEAHEAAMICEAVMTDNSVLAEIIAAVRATGQPIDQLPPLSAGLSAQLLAMRATMPVEPAEDDKRSQVPLPAIKVQPAPAAADEQGRRGIGIPFAALVLAIAASIFAAIVLLGRGDNPLWDQERVVDGGADQGSQPEVPSAVPDVERPLPEKPPSQDPIKSIVKTPKPGKVAPPQSPDAPDSNPAIAAVTPPSPAVANDPPPEKMPMPPSELDPLSARDPLRIAAAVPRMSDVRWTEISGLLAQRNPLSAAIGSRRGPTWRRIQEGSPSASTPVGTAAPSGAVELRTLPFSRAAGEFPTGGRVVISGDTGLQLTRGDADASAEVDLMYGSIAMVDVPDGTVVKFQQGEETIATLRWQEKASAVVQRFTNGLQILVDGGGIEINNTPVKEKMVQVAGQTVETMRAPKRLPSWVTRGDDSTADERLILAQIADTDDLTASLNRKIAALATSPTLRRDDARLLAKLASWQAAMAGPGLFRLAAHRVPAVRLAALQHLAQLSESDPRYERTWNAIDRSVNNPQRSAQMRLWFRLLRNGARPNAAQLEHMLAGLSSRDFAGRALSDFMLRQYVGNPPPFDPSWTGQRLQRAAAIYRERAGLPMDRARPNAAATDLR